MDDPLSAVDAHVGKHLFEECIKKYLGDKVVILVTHQIQYLKEATNILMLKAGEVEVSGTYQTLLSSGTDFSEFMTEEDAEDEDNASLVKEMETTRVVPETATQFKDMTSGIKKRVRTLSIMSGDSSTSMMEVSVSRQNLAVDPVDEKAEEEKKLIAKTSEEVKETGAVSFNTYKDFFLSGTSLFVVIMVIVLNVTVHTLFAMTDVWLGMWSNSEEAKLKNISDDLRSGNVTQEVIDEEFSLLSSSNAVNLGILAIFTTALMILSLVRTIHFLVMCKNASISLHGRMFDKIIRAPTRFFDVNPVGRVLNRFSKDIGSIDELLPACMVDVLTVSIFSSNTMVYDYCLFLTDLPSQGLCFRLMYQ